MLPIATVQGVREGISTGMIIDLSEYLKKAEGVSKEEFNSLEEVVGQKLDSEPIHKHHIEDIKQLESVLNNKFDKSEKYSYNVILSDSEKISFLESPKMLTMEIASKFDVEGYKFYVDDSSGDLMITLNDILIGSYSKSGNNWLLNGLETDMNNCATKDHVHDDKYYSKTEVDTKITNHTHENIDNNLTISGNIYKNLVSSEKQLEIRTASKDSISMDLGKVAIVMDDSENSYIALTAADLHFMSNKLWFFGTECNMPSTKLLVQNVDILAKINELETILQNHYQALKILCEKHEMIDSNANDGSNITPE